MQAGSNDPVLVLLSRGLELWLRQRCESIDDLQIRLQGNTVQLLRGRLKGVLLQARGVIFQQLEIERVELRSDPLQVRMGLLLRSQGVQFQHPFRIAGCVAFSAEGLSRSLARPPWSQLGDALAEQLLGLAPLAGLRFQGEQLILRSVVMSDGNPLERGTRVDVEDGGLVLRAVPGPADDLEPVTDASEARLPRDPGIRIERAEVGGGLLELHGSARVSP